MLASVKFKVKVGKVGNSLKPTLPKELAEFLKITKGSEAYWYEENGKVYFAKAQDDT